MNEKIKKWFLKPIDWKLIIPIGIVLIWLGWGTWWAVLGLVVLISGLVQLNEWDKKRRGIVNKPIRKNFKKFWLKTFSILFVIFTIFYAYLIFSDKTFLTVSYIMETILTIAFFALLLSSLITIAYKSIQPRQ